MFSFCKIGGLARAFCQTGCLASANLGDLVPRRAVFSAGSRGLVPFRGETSSLIPAVGRILRFGTRKSRPGKSRPGISPRPGNQIAEVGRNRGLNRTGGTKSPVLGRGVPNAQSWHDGHQIPAPEKGRLIAVTRPEIGLGLRRCRRDDDRGPRPFRL